MTYLLCIVSQALMSCLASFSIVNVFFALAGGTGTNKALAHKHIEPAKMTC